MDDVWQAFSYGCLHEHSSGDWTRSAYLFKKDVATGSKTEGIYRRITKSYKGRVGCRGDYVIRQIHMVGDIEFICRDERPLLCTNAANDGN